LAYFFRIGVVREMNQDITGYLRRNKFFAFVLALIICVFAYFKGAECVLTESKTVKIGTPAVEFNLPGTDGKNYSNESFKDAKVLVIVITCNHCPYAKAAWPLLINLQHKYKEQSVQFVAINPNDDVEYPEDSFENMKGMVNKLGINMPYLRDENQEIARKLNAVCTPDIFVYGHDRNLYYHGRINDNWQNPEKVTSNDLDNAINGLLNGDPPPKNQMPSMGCSIKWKK